MKTHSANIRATAGILAVHNLNVFPGSGGDMDYTVPWQDSFKEACRRAAIIAKMSTEQEYFGDDSSKLNLVTLSIPRFEILGEGRYKLVGGIFVWAGHFFETGAVFRVHGNDLNIETPELVQVCTPVRAKMEEMKYDTYNAAKLGEISDEVLKELDITLDKSKLAYAYLEDGEEGRTWEDIEEESGEDGFAGGYSEVKYMSIYAEHLTGGEPGRVVAFVKHDEAGQYSDYRTPDLGFDASYAKQIMDSWKALYDNYFVEFTDKTQPFAYIAIELFNEPAESAPVEARPEVYGDDFKCADMFAYMFDKSNLENMKAFGVEKAIETLDQIAS
jgi:hypothetical protein